MISNMNPPPSGPNIAPVGVINPSNGVFPPGFVGQAPLPPQSPAGNRANQPYSKNSTPRSESRSKANKEGGSTKKRSKKNQKEDPSLRQPPQFPHPNQTFQPNEQAFAHYGPDMVEDADDGEGSLNSIKLRCSNRFTRNNILIAELMNETVMPDVRSVVTTQRLDQLRRQSESLVSHQEKFQNELTTMEKNFSDKKQKIMDLSKDFEKKMSSLPRPKTDNEAFSKMFQDALSQIDEKYKKFVENETVNNGTQSTDLQRPPSSVSSAVTAEPNTTSPTVVPPVPVPVAEKSSVSAVPVQTPPETPKMNGIVKDEPKHDSLAQLLADSGKKAAPIEGSKENDVRPKDEPTRTTVSVPPSLPPPSTTPQPQPVRAQVSPRPAAATPPLVTHPVPTGPPPQAPNPPYGMHGPVIAQTPPQPQQQPQPPPPPVAPQAVHPNAPPFPQHHPHHFARMSHPPPSSAIASQHIPPPSSMAPQSQPQHPQQQPPPQSQSQPTPPPTSQSVVPTSQPNDTPPQGPPQQPPGPGMHPGGKPQQMQHKPQHPGPYGPQHPYGQHPQHPGQPYPPRNYYGQWPGQVPPGHSGQQQTPQQAYYQAYGHPQMPPNSGPNKPPQGGPQGPPPGHHPQHPPSQMDMNYNLRNALSAPSAGGPGTGPQHQAPPGPPGAPGYNVPPHHPHAQHPQQGPQQRPPLGAYQQPYPPPPHMAGSANGMQSQAAHQMGHNSSLPQRHPGPYPGYGQQIPPNSPYHPAYAQHGNPPPHGMNPNHPGFPHGQGPQQQQRRMPPGVMPGSLPPGMSVQQLSAHGTIVEVHKAVEQTPAPGEKKKRKSNAAETPAKRAKKDPAEKKPKAPPKEKKTPAKKKKEVKVKEDDNKSDATEVESDDGTVVSEGGEDVEEKSTKKSAEKKSATKKSPTKKPATKKKPSVEDDDDEEFDDDAIEDDDDDFTMNSLDDDDDEEEDDDETDEETDEDDDSTSDSNDVKASRAKSRPKLRSAKPSSRDKGSKGGSANRTKKRNLRKRKA